jgi:hypothetical protein
MNPIRIHKQKEQVIDLYVTAIAICVGDRYGERLEAVEFMQESLGIAKTLNIEANPVSAQHKLVRQIHDFLDLIERKPFDDHDTRAVELYQLAREYKNGNP